MNIEEVRDYCLLKKGAMEDFPFGESTSVMRIGGKIFALMNLDGPPSINLKCNPVRAVELREAYPSIRPGYHMNKKHWNTVMLDGSIPGELIISMMDDSYELVLDSLTGNLKKEIKEIEN